MSEILPIDREDLKEEEEQIVEKVEENKKEGLEAIQEEEEEEESTPPPPKKQEDIFNKPKKEIKVEISKKTGKPKRKLTEAQLDNLRKAREKSQAKRKALKEAKEIAEASKKEERRLKREEKLKKKEEEEAMINLKAKMYKEAQSKAHWDEEKLQKLIEKSIDGYIEKKKKQKPAPKEFIPVQQAYPHLPPTAPQNIANSYNYIPQQYAQQPMVDPRIQAQNYMRVKKQKQNKDVMNTLFGDFS